MELQEYNATRAHVDAAVEEARRIVDDFDRQQAAAELAANLVTLVRKVRKVLDLSSATLRLIYQMVDHHSYSAERMARFAADAAAARDLLIEVRRLRSTVSAKHPQIKALWTENLDRDIAALVVRHEEAMARFSEALRTGVSPDEERRRAIRRAPWTFPRSATGPTALYDTPPPDDVVDFVVREDLDEDLDVAIQVITKTFPDARNLRLELDRDPEGVEEWVLMRFETPDIDLDDRLDAYWDMIRRVVPRTQADKLRIIYRVL